VILRFGIPARAARGDRHRALSEERRPGAERHVRALAGVSRAWFAALSCVVLWGCPISPTFTARYEVLPQPPRGEASSAAVAVRRFADERPPRVYTTQGRMFMAYIPLLPYVSLPFERTDENVRLLSEEIGAAGGALPTMTVAPDFEQYAYPESFARAIADDLRALGLFREVNYTGEAPPAAGERYVLDGVLRATPLKLTVTSYCLGAPGVLLWLLPIPAGKATGSVTLDLTLTDTEQDAVVWQRTAKGEVSRLLTTYTSRSILYGTTMFSYQMVLPPSDVQVDRISVFAWHFEALRRAMDDVRRELVAAVARR
jgi:hypothetical protein